MWLQSLAGNVASCLRCRWWPSSSHRRFGAGALGPAFAANTGAVEAAEAVS